MSQTHSLRAILTIPFLFVIVLVIALVGIISFLNAQRAISDLIQPLLEEITAHTEHQITRFFEVPSHIIQRNAAAIYKGWIDGSDPDALKEYFISEIRLFPSVTSIYFGNPQGGLVNAGREGPDGDLYAIMTDRFQKGTFRKFALSEEGEETSLIAVVPDFDATIRPWYQNAVSARELVWNEPYFLATGQDLAIALSMPVYDDHKQLMGVVSVDVFLSHLDHFLSNTRLGAQGKSFLMDSSGSLIATSIFEPIISRENPNNGPQRILAWESSSPQIRSAAETVFSFIQEGRDTHDLKGSVFQIDQESHYLQVHVIRHADDARWFLVTTISESLFMDQIYQNNRSTLVFTLMALFFAGVVGFFLSRAVARPISALEQSASELANGKAPKPAIHSNIREIQNLNRSFYHMSQTLQSTIHSLKRRDEMHREAEQVLIEKNEEIHASHEELQAMKEQLEATNEELLSSMEQLEANNQVLAESEKVLQAREKELIENKTRAFNQRAAVVKLFLDPSIASGNLEAATKILTEVLSTSVQVERASVWLINEEKRELQCIDLFQQTKSKHLSGSILPMEMFPSYFQALYHDSRIYAEDAQQDQRTYELAEKYLIPAGITSLLDASITSGGKIVGVVSLEHIGPKRKWHPDEEAFITTAATIVSQVLAIQERRKLDEENALFVSIFESSSDLIALLDADFSLVYMNQQGKNLIGWDDQDVQGMGIRELYPDRISPSIFETALPTAFANGIWSGESMLIHEAGREIPVNQVIMCHKNENGVAQYYSTIITDTSDLVTYKEQAEFSSGHDSLTGLFNRSFFDKELNHRETKGGAPITILSADVDGLRLINESFGHEQGNEVLKASAQILKESLRETDIIARVGGDEFAILLPNTEEETAKLIQKRIESTTESFNRSHPNLPISISIGMAHAQETDHSLEELFQESENAMMRQKLHKGTSVRSHIIETLMTALGERDFITQGHAIRLSELCERLAGRIELSQSQIDTLKLLAQVHDLGKVGIPDQILFKKGPLTKEEWEIMRLHPEKGYRIASASPDLSGIADFILKHHEKWDGTGYPLGLAGEAIPLECRILAIADAFDAMTSDRPYRDALSAEVAIKEIKRSSGSQFDPDLVEVFLELMKENPL